MNDDRITYYRTDAFHKGEDGSALHFWTLDPAYNAPGRFYVREHETGKSHRYSARISPDMTEREALRKLAELEENARKKFKPVDTTNDGHLRRMGDNYTEAIPYRQHPVLVAEERQARLNRLPKPKFKP